MGCGACLSGDLQPGDTWGEDWRELLRAHWVGSGGEYEGGGSSRAIKTH